MDQRPRNASKARTIGNAYPESVRVSLVHGQQSLRTNAAVRDGKKYLTDAPGLMDLELPPGLQY